MRVLLPIAALFVLVVVWAAANPPVAASRADRWKKVQEAENKGLPKTAIDALGPIIESAAADKAFPEAARAILKRIALEGTIQGNKPEERVTRLKAEIAKAPKELVPVFDAVLGHWYWHYFQQNRWRFMQRTATAAPPGEDFTTWDLPRIFAAIDAQFTKALAAEKELKATPIAAFDALLERGTLPDSYRPTLWDFLAFEALAFYTSAEQAAAKPGDAFEIDAASPALGTADEFLAWKPETTDADSPKLKAVKLYQAVMAFHKADADRAAFLDADLARLHFAYNAGFGDEKAARTKAALKRFADAHADHELSAKARYEWALVLQAENEPAAARQIAMQGKNAFPNSVGGMQCHNLIQQIEAKQLAVTAERVWAAPGSEVRVRYANITKVHFRLYAADWVARLGGNRWRPEELGTADVQALVKQPPTKAWAADLPATDDYKQRTEDVPAPDALAPGFYYLLASGDPNFGEADNQVAYTFLWVSDLAVVLRQEQNAGRVGGFVLNNRTGLPVAGADVKAWVRQPRGGFADGPAVKTDANGLFAIAGENFRGVYLLASHGGHKLSTTNEAYISRSVPRQHSFARTVLFADRALYRPGQTVHYKGIRFLADTRTDDYKTLADQPVTVVFQDPNGKEIAKHQTRSNAFGSFSGSFTAPRDRLTGAMQIVVPGDAAGYTGASVRVQVEEYKRPKFQVAVEPPAESPKLSGPVTLAGKATAYTGAAVNGAKVRYRVTREVRWPTWFYGAYWWRMPPQGSAQEIAHGTAVTEADGSFKITFTAKPDASVPEKDEPTFHYAVTVDVTDTTGETRTGSRDVAVGYTALQANVSAGAWLTADAESKFTVKTTSLDGDGRPAKGTLTVYAVQQPDAVIRPDLIGDRPPPRRRGGRPAPATPAADPADPRTWETGAAVATLPFETDNTGTKELAAKLPVGLYRAVVTTTDRFGKPVTARADLRVIDPAAAKLAIKIPDLFAAEKWTLEPGEAFKAVWGTGYDTGRAYLEIEHRGKVLQAFWTDPAKTQATIAQDVTEAMRGGFTVRATFVRENRAYLHQQHVEVPWSNKDLAVKWERFVSKLEPAKKETFAAVITGPRAVATAAEMVAALYDASLDAYLPHDWMHHFNAYRRDNSMMNLTFENMAQWLNHGFGQWATDFKGVAPSYRKFPDDVTVNMWRYQFRGEGGGRGGFGGGGAPGAPPAAAPMAEAKAEAGDRVMLGRAADGMFLNAAGGEAKSGPDLSKVAARANLNELAFFFPHLTADAAGTVRMEFAMPEALTKWKFLGFAHTTDLKGGYITGEVVTAKDLMVQPNPPRFLREGDVLEFSVKVSNQSAGRQVGKVRLSLTDLRSGTAIDEPLGNTAGDQAFDLAAGESKAFAWKLTVPDGQGAVQYKAVAATERLSDGEEGAIPVLSKRVLVTESLPLPIRDKGTKTFEFTKLLDAAKSGTLKHQSLTVQMTSQPAWYAVLALPYLMEFPHECSEQTFNRLYANALAQHIAKSDPKVRRVFDQWKNTPAVDSPLVKNQDLKAVTAEETPWLRDAIQEGEARRNVGVLFDDNRLTEETARTLRKLAEMQRDDGTWPWFPGGPKNEYLSLYIATGFGRLRKLGVPVDVAPAVKAWAALDAWANEMYARIKPDQRAGNHLSATVALYLYGRSFFLADVPVAPANRTAFDYWVSQAKAHWLSLNNRQSHGHLALALHRLGDRAAAAGILASIRERSVSDAELGTFWRDTELSYWWYRAPIETQALMIEAFDEVGNDAAAVEGCKVWLLKQKQTQNWKTTKATADAVYALLMRGTNLLSSDALVEVTVGDVKVQPEKTEAGTGFYEERFVRTEVKPEFGKLTVTKPDAGVSWGSVHWQYLEDVTKVTPHDGTPLKLEKALFKRTLTKKGPVLEPAAGPLAVGDEVIVRVVLRTDRDMEYVHLKDHRGSGTEPVNVLSRYKFQDGLGYYESTKDTASHFFIDYLPKGVYVFEYPVRVQHKGRYPTGLASVQCMYAPEFNSHSASVPMEVK